MNKLLVMALLGGLTFGTVATAQAQNPVESPDFPSASPAAKERANSRRAKKLKAQDVAEEQRRAALSPEDQKIDEQMRLLEARAGFGGGTGNTSFNRSGPDRQLESRSGGFTVKKYKAKAGTSKQKRGLSHPVGGSDPQGKPLTHKRAKRPSSGKGFLFFNNKRK